MRIGLVRCLELPEPDMDEAPLLDALREAGHEAGTLAWDGNRAIDDPGRYDACVIRATWNYWHATEAFDAWLGRAADATRLLNPVEAVRWNTHKGYLLELESAGVPIIPTELVRRGETRDVRALASRRGWAAGVVVKPAVSGGSWKTERFGPGDLDRASGYVASSARARDTLVQAYVPSVKTGGERAVCVIGGEPSHAVVKMPRYAGEDESLGAAVGVDAASRAFADRVLGLVGHELVFARVDVFEDGAGGLLLGELELIEPSLYFPMWSGSAARMAGAIESALAD